MAGITVENGKHKSTYINRNKKKDVLYPSLKVMHLISNDTISVENSIIIHPYHSTLPVFQTPSRCNTITTSSLHLLITKLGWERNKQMFVVVMFAQGDMTCSVTCIQNVRCGMYPVYYSLTLACWEVVLGERRRPSNDLPFDHNQAKNLFCFDKLPNQLAIPWVIQTP